MQLYNYTLVRLFIRSFIFNVNFIYYQLSLHILWILLLRYSCISCISPNFSTNTWKSRFRCCNRNEIKHTRTRCRLDYTYSLAKWQPSIELIIWTLIFSMLGFQLIKSVNQLIKRWEGGGGGGVWKNSRGGKLGFTCRRFLIEVSRSRGKLSISARCCCVAINRPERNLIPAIRMR